MKRTKAIRHFARQAAMTLLIAFLAVATTHAQTEYPEWGSGDGSEENPYVITNTAGLDLLASKVNSGMDFGMTYFVLGADITYSHNTDWDDEESTESNFTPIGTTHFIFAGTFDGQGHTISGIRIYSTDNFGGLFGWSYDGTVRNVILADARIAGKDYVGGIVGSNLGTIENCHVCANVAIDQLGNSYGSSQGGIVGQNDGTVNGCTSAATVSGPQNCGGIVGENTGTVSNCRAVGVKLFGDINLGAIVGYNLGGTLSHNYYCRCTSCDKGVGNGTDDNFSDDGAVRTETIPLFDDASNAGLIAVCSSRVDDRGRGISDDYTLFGRTLYKDGSWNTICLPFELTYWGLSNALGGPTTIMKLASTTFDDGKLSMNFEEVLPGDYFLDTGTPYIVRWTRADDYTNDDDHNLVNPTFQSARITTTMTPATTEYVDFIGTTSPVSLAAGDRTVLFLGSGNQLYYPSDAMTIGSFRGYFKLKNGLTAGEPTAPKAVRSLVLNFGDGEASGIENVQWSMVNGQWSMDNGQSEAWFTLDGRRLSGKPTAKGLYIHEGRAVVIK